MIDTNLGPSTTPAAPRKLQTPRTGNFLGRLSVGQKLLLSGLLLGVPAGALVVNILNAEQAQINTLDTQIKGQQFLEPLAQTQYRIRSARPLAFAYSTGDQKVTDKYKQASAEALAQLDTAAKLAQQNGDTELVNQIKATRQAYSNLTDGLLNKRVSYPEYISGTGKILSADLLGLFNKVSEDYGMHLASNEKMYDLLRISTEQLPATFPVVAATFAEGVNSARTAAGLCCATGPSSAAATGGPVRGAGK
ncbi:hypothetical protein [Deinococcus sp. Marseille-Q6407]|uniref:hypothetical protein n=1 Tax=Deinococcus sp. Marseille-Q6407 TaxID=2969223 RepID=UPI0021BF83AA|nr:hypothetical protein [Deinococcus sp. Marseille-Q6407]